MYLLYKCYTIKGKIMNKFTYKMTIRKDRPLKNGEYSICLLLIFARYNRRLSLNISTKMQNWDARAQIVKKGDPDNERKNKLLIVYKNRISAYETDCIVRGRVINLEDAMNKALNPGLDIKEDQSFFAYLKKRWPHYEATLKHNTVRKYRSHLNILKSFRRSLNFSEIDIDFVKCYETFLIAKKGNSKNTVAKAIKWIKTIISQAIEDRVIDFSPISKYKVSIEPSNREYLTVSEIKKLHNLYVGGSLSNTMTETLRAFLFCCYTGLRVSDMKKLEYKDIREEILFTVMEKTQILIPVPLIKSAKLLIEGRCTGIVFNTVSDQMLNKHLVKIMKMVNINKRITFHCARHTFSTNSLDCGVRKDSLQKVLGHQDIKTTDIYTHYTITYLKKEMIKLDRLFR